MVQTGLIYKITQYNEYRDHSDSARTHRIAAMMDETFPVLSTQVFSPFPPVAYSSSCPRFDISTAN